MATLLRGGIETNFRFLKSNFKFDKLNSKKLDLIKQNLYACQFLFIIESLINYITPNESINLNDIISDIIPKDNDINLKIKKSEKNDKNNLETNNKVNIETNNKNEIIEINNEDNKQKIKSTNKSLSFNLIGNHLLKSTFITKIKKKEKQKIYKTKYKKTKENVIFLKIILPSMENIIRTFNEIIKNKIDMDMINKNNK